MSYGLSALGVAVSTLISAGLGAWAGGPERRAKGALIVGGSTLAMGVVGSVGAYALDDTPRRKAWAAFYKKQGQIAYTTGDTKQAAQMFAKAGAILAGEDDPPAGWPSSGVLGGKPGLFKPGALKP